MIGSGIQDPALVQIWQSGQVGLHTQRPQSTVSPQLLTTFPHRPLQVCAIGWAEQPVVQRPQSMVALQLLVWGPQRPAQVVEIGSGWQIFLGFLSFFFFFFPSAWA